MPTLDTDLLGGIPTVADWQETAPVDPFPVLEGPRPFPPPLNTAQALATAGTTEDDGETSSDDTASDTTSDATSVEDLSDAESDATSVEDVPTEDTKAPAETARSSPATPWRAWS
ncbi:hypothetical protein NKH77_28905 [Streptomyces sp. M19]